MARYCRIVCLDRGRHLRHAQLNGEANNTRLRGVGSGRRDPGAGSGVVSGTGAAADQPVLRRAVYGAGPRGVLCRGAPARLRRAVAGPDRAVVREGGKPDDPQLYCRRAGGGVRSIGRPRAQSPPDATTPGGRSREVTATASPRLSTDLRLSPEQDLWKGHAGSAERLIAARVVSGEDGLTSFDRPGQIVIEISRLPVAEKESARRCARRDRQDHSRLPGERHPDRGPGGRPHRVRQRRACRLRAHRAGTPGLQQEVDLLRPVRLRDEAEAGRQPSEPRAQLRRGRGHGARHGRRAVRVRRPGAAGADRSSAAGHPGG